MATVLETVPSEFDYFQSRAIQAAIVREYDESFSPIGTIQPGTPIEISIPASGNQYSDLNNSRLEVKCKIVQADGGTAIPAAANVGPVNLMLHSMFSNVEMDVCGKRISDANFFYPYRAFFETFLSYTKDVQNTRLQSEGWIKDTSQKFQNFLLTAEGATNLGHKERAAWFAQSAIVAFCGRPHLDLFHQEKSIPPGCPMFFRFIPSNSNFYLKKPATNENNYKLEILSFKLWVRTKEVIPSVQLAHDSMLGKGFNIRIPYTKVEVSQLTIPNGVSSHTFSNVFTGRLPNRLLLAVVQDTTLNANASSNPFLFSNADISFLQFEMNGECFPRTPYQPNFGTRDYMREYMGLLEALNIDIGTQAIDLTPSEWARTYPFFMFSTDPGHYPSIPRSGSSRLVIHFRTATAHVYKVICFAEFPSLLEIDKFHNALL